MDDAPTIDEIALGWAIRTAQPGFQEWDAFMAWLGGDAARNLAYDRAIAMVVDAGATPPGATGVVVPLPARVPARAVRAAPVPRRRWIGVAAGAALAAGIAGVLVIGQADGPSSLRIVEAAPGRSRTIALADGSRIALAGGSRVRLDAARPRWARVDRGHVVFDVRHDATAPYRVEAGGYRIVDAGTTFEVAHDRAATRVAVAEGRVIVDPATVRLSLAAGQAADLVAGRAPRVEQVRPAAVGQWRNDRMRYDDAPLPDVAADLSIALGQPIVVDASVRERRFSGTITPATLRGRPGDVAALFGIRVAESPRGWAFLPR
ncbi:hypothetical protein ASG29_03425 [Sphingomonas sp. Leaf412]|uniref:FecR family protein n=1 Tax=Sphingomonas sp. Leaf412 TaxID=1736370 RepID=UPI0006FA68AC|nr:FecR domain-containing protein [Sphingomonas sp. Leaf412]KQT35175.1 hypothetical protein ASG29_03425 [Sphingomonas sp. Leaf412]